MTVYVDDAGISARIGPINSRWYHLTADTREELHEFATRLGLKRSWFQPGNKSGLAKPGSFSAEAWHYDVTESKREQAIRLGAEAITSERMNELILARAPLTRERRTKREADAV